jgi:predicted O-methyltransferase YrrM
MKIKNLFYRAFQNLHAQQALEQLRDMERRLVAPQARLAVPFLYRGPGFYKSIAPMQSQCEIAELYAAVRALQPRRVIEIGTCHGGTLYLWCQAAHSQATLFSVDLPDGEFGGGYRDCRAALYRAFAGPGQTLHLLRGNSHLKETVDHVRGLLGGQFVDFLFVDGDHTYSGVRQDFDLFSPLVRPGGLIALHDIVPREAQPRIEVWKFWRELKAKYPEAREFLDSTENGRRIGIGLLEWRG